jgi:hypothetical protein
VLSVVEFVVALRLVEEGLRREEEGISRAIFPVLSSEVFFLSRLSCCTVLYRVHAFSKLSTGLYSTLGNKKGVRHEANAKI